MKWAPERVIVPDAVVGEALVRRWHAESDSGMRHCIAAALGVVRYPPGWERLKAALREEDPVLRRMAGWGLRNAQPKDAEQPLREALARETNSKAATAMRAALEASVAP